ncbi:hypothetical protein [Candidatus Enterococcus murrayae]|uniref:Uncharacterized protein n=1 Tax=Candidatus Enterococcus murrayae TaxID=2815321 RepID=A0ABS3HG68_9ENTE|nr:hypothetical protein [Enterococcus sp. MJM16]MBO0452434.1 hypothetical protein [Enterococcus sp. MJM16]
MEYNLAVMDNEAPYVMVYSKEGSERHFDLGSNEDKRRVALIKEGFHLVAVSNGIEYWEKMKK